MKKTILVNVSCDVIMKGMNEKVRNKVNIKDKLGMTDFYFCGSVCWRCMDYKMSIPE